MKIDLPLQPPQQNFSQAIQDLGFEKVISARPVLGGDINHAYKLEVASKSGQIEVIFMKANSRQNADFFRTEVVGLQAIASLGILKTPKVLAWGIDEGNNNPLRGPCSFLLLEFLTPTAKASNYWETFGQNLARFHLADCSHLAPHREATIPPNSQSKYFGFTIDNYIGATVQKNQGKSSWVDFFRECRLGPPISMGSKIFFTETTTGQRKFFGPIRGFFTRA